MQAVGSYRHVKVLQEHCAVAGEDYFEMAVV